MTDIADTPVEQGVLVEITLHLTSEDMMIKVSEENTIIVCGGKQSLRLLRDLLLQSNFRCKIINSLSCRSVF